MYENNVFPFCTEGFLDKLNILKSACRNTGMMTRYDGYDVKNGYIVICFIFYTK